MKKAGKELFILTLLPVKKNNKTIYTLIRVGWKQHVFKHKNYRNSKF
jgi:hypothetical protein